MQNNEIHYLIDMLEAAKLIQNFSQGINRNIFNQDLMRQAAIIRELEIIGEAANRISETTQLEFPQIYWRKIIGMRNRLIHEYDDLDLDIIWNTIQNYIQPLITEIEQIINSQN